jgi:hypothetical protein
MFWKKPNIRYRILLLKKNRQEAKSRQKKEEEKKSCWEGRCWGQQVKKKAHK